MAEKSKIQTNQVKVTEYEILPGQFGQEWIDVPYCNQSPNQKLDIILPKEGKGPFPTMILIHGGAWKYGFKRSHVIQSMYKISSQGYAIVSVDFRCSGEEKWPGMLYDCKAAVRFIRANGEKYNLDTDKIGAYGNSSGGHILAVMAATNGNKEFEDLSMGNAEYSSDIDLAILWYTPTDVYNCLEEATQKNEMIDELMGFDVLANPKSMCDKANAIINMGSKFPITLLQAGNNDTIVPYSQSLKFYNAIVDKCGEDRVTLEVFEGATHGDPVFKSDENINHCLDFMDKYFEIDRTKYPRTNLPEIFWSDIEVPKE